jgi:hypothetical protein
MHDEQQWTCVHLDGRPTPGNENGTGDDLDDCKAQFRKTGAHPVRAEAAGNLQLFLQPNSRILACIGEYQTVRGIS